MAAQQEVISHAMSGQVIETVVIVLFIILASYILFSGTPLLKSSVSMDPLPGRSSRRRAVSSAESKGKKKDRIRSIISDSDGSEFDTRMSGISMDLEYTSASEDQLPKKPKVDEGDQQKKLLEKQKLAKREERKQEKRKKKEEAARKKKEKEEAERKIKEKEEAERKRKEREEAEKKKEEKKLVDSDTDVDGGNLVVGGKKDVVSAAAELEDEHSGDAISVNSNSALLSKHVVGPTVLLHRRGSQSMEDVLSDFVTGARLVDDTSATLKVRRDVDSSDDSGALNPLAHLIAHPPSHSD
jgi:hypothetical protein